MIIYPSGRATSQSIDYRGFPEWSWGKKDSTEYYLYSPVSAGKGKPLPIILFLHGCCGEDYHATLRNAVDPPVRLWHDFGENKQVTPTFILSPKTKVGWSQHFENIKAVIDSLVTHKRVDPQRIYISGFSMGSAGTWEFIEAYPNYFAAAIAMGMDFKGKDPAKFRDIPIWAIRGDEDWWARNLGTQVKMLRAQSVAQADSLDWHTGVNPRLTNFKGKGHVVMWPAVKELPLAEWLFSKVNDGNKYPVVVCHSPTYLQQFKEGEKIKLQVEALDPDGQIVKTIFKVNGALLASNSGSPGNLEFVARKGDNVFSITVFDDKGKSVTETGIVRVDIPTNIPNQAIPTAREARFFSHVLTAQGNGRITWKLVNSTSMPEGLTLKEDGTLIGVPSLFGSHAFKVVATDEDFDTVEKSIAIKVDKKHSSDVVIKNVKNHLGNTLALSALKKGVTPHVRGDDEVSISWLPAKYKNFTLIQTEPNDTTTSGSHYLEFESDEPVRVYVAYERLSNRFKSTIPHWLKEFKEEGEEIVAQYYYYGIFSKPFPKGKITLPHSLEKANGVNTNYFVFVQKDESH